METAIPRKISFHQKNARHPLILLPTWVNGRGPFTFVLDTGANATLVTPELASSLGLEHGEKRAATGAQGNTELILSTVESLEVGGESLAHLSVGIRDLSRLSEAIGAPVDGDLGFNFLRHFTVVIDYPGKLFQLLRDGDGVHQSGSSSAPSIPFRLAHPEKTLLLVPAFLNGTGPFELILDTGAGVTVFSPELAMALGIKSAGGIPMTGGGDGVRPMGSMGQVASLAIGPARVENLQVLVADFFAPLSQAVSVKLEGILGYNFLRNFRVTIDYPRLQLFLA